MPGRTRGAAQHSATPVVYIAGGLKDRTGTISCFTQEIATIKSILLILAANRNNPDFEENAGSG